MNRHELLLVMNTNAEPEPFVEAARAVDVRLTVRDTREPSLVESLRAVSGALFYAPSSLPPALSYAVGLAVGRDLGALLVTGPFSPPGAIRGVVHRIWQPTYGTDLLRDLIAALSSNPLAFKYHEARELELPARSQLSRAPGTQLPALSAPNVRESPQVADSTVLEVRRLLARLGASDFTESLERGSLPRYLKPDLMLWFSSPPKPLDQVCPVEVVLQAETIEKKRRTWTDMLDATGRNSLLVVAERGRPKRTAFALREGRWLIALSLDDLRQAANTLSPNDQLAHLIQQGLT